MDHTPPIYAFIKAKVDQDYWLAAEVHRTINMDGSNHDQWIDCIILRASSGCVLKQKGSSNFDSTGEVEVSEYMQTLYTPTSRFNFDYYDTLEDLCADHIRELL